MATKWKGNKRAALMSFAGFILVFAGFLMMASVLAYPKEISSYIQGDDYAKISFPYEERDELANLVKTYLYEKETKGGSDPVTEKKIEGYLEQGYRYAACRSDGEFFLSDGENPVYANREEMQNDYDPPLYFISSYSYAVVVYHETLRVDENFDILYQLVLNLREGDLSDSERETCQDKIDSLTERGYRWAITAPDGQVVEDDGTLPLYQTIQEISDACYSS